MFEFFAYKMMLRLPPLGLPQWQGKSFAWILAGFVSSPGPCVPGGRGGG